MNKIISLMFLTLIILLLFSSLISLLLLIPLIMISFFIICKIGLFSHSLLLIYYSLLFLAVFKLAWHPISGFNLLYENIAAHKGSCWDPCSFLNTLLYFPLLYLNILAFAAISMLMILKFIYLFHLNFYFSVIELCIRDIFS